MDVGSGSESHNGGASVGFDHGYRVVPEHKVVHTKIGALLHGIAGGGEQDDDERVGGLLGERGVERMQGDIVDGEGGVVGDIGESKISTTAHHIALLGGGIVVGAEKQHTAIVAAAGGLVFVAAGHSCRLEASKVNTAGNQLVDINRGQRGKNLFDAVHVGEHVGDNGEKGFEVDSACGED